MPLGEASRPALVLLLYWPPETPVLLAGEIRATVMAVSVRSGPHVNYQVVWWSGLDRHKEWVHAGEVEPVDASREIKLGF
jgi:hypothetical protein